MVFGGGGRLGVRAVADGEVAEYAGDALYTMLLYALVVLVAPRLRPSSAAVWAVGLSWAVEVFQLTGVPDDLARRSGLARLVLGSTFNAPDLFWYLVGAGLAALVHAGSPGARDCPGRLRRRDHASHSTIMSAGSGCPSSRPFHRTPHRVSRLADGVGG